MKQIKNSPMEQIRDPRREVWRKLFDWVERNMDYGEIDATFKIHENQLREVIIKNLKYKFRPDTQRERERE